MRNDIPAINQICDDLKAGNISLNQSLYWLQMHSQASKSPDKAASCPSVFSKAPQPGDADYVNPEVYKGTKKIDWGKCMECGGSSGYHTGECVFYGAR